jgi:hypothetical protein
MAKKTVKKPIIKEEIIVEEVIIDEPIVEIPKVELYNDVKILSKVDKGDATLLVLEDGTTTIVENKYL